MKASLFILGAAVALAFFPGSIYPATVPRWAVMAVGVPICMAWRPFAVPAKLLLTTALAAAAVSITWSPSYLSGLNDFSHVLILAAAFCLGGMVEDLTSAWIGLAVGVNVSAVIAVAQHFGWTAVPQVVPPAGLFVNRNLLAEAGMVTLVAMVFQRRWILVPGCLIAALLPLSRAVAGALILVTALWYIARRRWLTVILVLTTCASALVAFRSASGQLRLAFWADALEHLAWFGNGLGSFIVNYPSFEYAHSDSIQLVYELGLLGAPAALLIFYAFGGKRETERFILFSVIAVGALSFPMHMPVTGFAAALAAGHLAACRDRICLGNVVKHVAGLFHFKWASNTDMRGRSRSELSSDVVSTRPQNESAAHGVIQGGRG